MLKFFYHPLQGIQPVDDPMSGQPLPPRFIDDDLGLRYQEVGKPYIQPRNEPTLIKLQESDTLRRAERARQSQEEYDLYNTKRK